MFLAYQRASRPYKRLVFDGLFEEIPESVKLVKSIDFPRKNKVFQGSAASFFHVFSTHVRPFFGIEIYIDFIMILGAILVQFSTLYDPLAIIWIFFRCRFFHVFLMPF